MLTNSIRRTLSMLVDSIANMEKEVYGQPLPVLSGSSIGQHVRHIAEMYVCLYEGMHEGVVCYEKRKRDTRIETDKNAALQLLSSIAGMLEQPDKPLLLLANFELNDETAISIPTSYQRELAYNLEHSIHHMAIIKIGLDAMKVVPEAEAFGVAPSTMRFRKQTQ